MAQPLLDQSQVDPVRYHCKEPIISDEISHGVDAGFQQMGGPTVTQRGHRGALVVATLFERGAEGWLHAALGHWLSRLHQVDVVTAFSGKEQPRMPSGFQIP